MPVTPVGIAFKLAYELSPIFLTGNSSVTGSLPQQMLPFVFLTEGINLPLSLASGGENIELDDFFAHFIPMPGATLQDNQIATYPFANQAIAANAIITQPLQISMRMICPVRSRLGYAAKIATMMLIKAALDAHNQQGGTYSVLTPSYFYTDCLMLKMTDISSGPSAQAQHTWQFDFVQPLIALDAAKQAANSLMTQLTTGAKVTSNFWSGVNAAIGNVFPGYASGVAGALPDAAALGAPIG